MKQTKIRIFMFALVVCTSLGLNLTTASADTVDEVTVTSKTPDQQVAYAKHKIFLIQSDPGYYYSGAWGAGHRVHDVNVQKDVIANAQRYPASVK